MTQKNQYLHEFLSALTESERGTISDLPLRGKEHDLLALYLRFIGKTAPSKDTISRELMMSPSHIDKTNSLVLKKCYEALAPKGYIQLWDLFRHRHLPRHMYHDFSLRERDIKKADDSKALAQFYLDAFETIHQLTYQDYDTKEAERFMRLYLELSPNISNGDRLMLEGRFFRQRITNQLASSKRVSSLVHLEKKLIELEQLIDASVEPLPIVQYDLAAAHFYKIVIPDTKKQRTYLMRAIEIVDKSPEQFALEDPPLLRLKVADTYFQDTEFEKAYRMYSELIPKEKDKIRTQFFHLATYAHLATLCQKYLETDEIIEEFFHPYANGQNWQLQTMMDVLSTKRYLASGEIEKAKKHIDSGFLTNEKGIIMSFDIELRKLETLYFALSGDFGFAEDLIAKHIKFLHSKKISVRESLHGKFFKVMREIINERTIGKKLPKKTEELLAEQSSSFQAIYGILLGKLRKQ